MCVCLRVCVFACVCVCMFVFVFNIFACMCVSVYECVSAFVCVLYNVCIHFALSGCMHCQCFVMHCEFVHCRHRRVSGGAGIVQPPVCQLCSVSVPFLHCECVRYAL